ncbi:MAG: PD-(D/E)XK nuclease-like domain-containing protein [Phycisphaerales bacterium]|nr:PD-(D/E)XK nuclease-like domain-containing protein [Phycisphaerales bacterium]
MPEAAVIDLRFLHREPAEVYHAKATSHLSSHSLADFRRCPLLFRRKELGLTTERDTEAYLVGRAAHVLMLEGRQRFEAEFAVGGPVNPKTGKPFGSGTKAFAEWAVHIGKPVLADDQAALVEQMAASVREHMFARELLDDGVAEGVVRCEYAGHACQARIDWINPVDGRGLVDLKTCDRLDSFELDISAFGYVHQLAFYRALVGIASGEELPVHIIAVEKREPFRCGVWQLSERALEQARRENEQAMSELARCRATGVWPTRFESMRLLDHL